MRSKFIVIEPHFTDIDTHCYFDISNGRCRASLEIYADMGMLGDVAAALEAPVLEHDWPRFSFDMADTYLGLGLSVSKGEPYRILRVRMVDVSGDHYRAEFDISLDAEEAAELAKDLREWIKAPEYHFIWNRFGWKD